MKNYLFEVEGMKCGGCATKIQNMKDEDQSINKVLVTLETKEVKIEGNDHFSAMKFKKDLDSLGFSVTKMEKGVGCPLYL